MAAEISGSAGSAGELARDLTEQVSRLFRDELKLAEYEMTRKARRLGRATPPLPGQAAGSVKADVAESTERAHR
jgi:hypothetical protein